MAWRFRLEFGDPIRSLKRKCNFHEIFVTSCTGSCNPWRRIRQNYDICYQVVCRCWRPAGHHSWSSSPVPEYMLTGILRDTTWFISIMIATNVLRCFFHPYLCGRTLPIWMNESPPRFTWHPGNCRYGLTCIHRHATVGTKHSARQEPTKADKGIGNCK